MLDRIARATSWRLHASGAFNPAIARLAPRNVSRPPGSACFLGFEQRRR
jgi:hypothetical protein